MYPRSNSDEELIPVQCMQTKAFRELVRSLNKEQMEFFYHVLHSVKTNKEQFTIFLSGGAGVGKTTVTHALFDALIRYYNSRAGENPQIVSKC